MTTDRRLDSLIRRAEIERERLIEECERIWERVDELDDKLWSYRVAQQDLCTSTDRTIREPKKGTLQWSILSIAEEVVRVEGPTHRDEIYKRIEEHGVHVGGANPINAVGSYLSRSERFVSNGHGVWGLVDESLPVSV